MQSSNSYFKGENSNEPKVHPDQKYIIALRENDYKLIEELYKLHSDMIYRMVKTNNGSEDDAKDVMQEGIITLHRYAQEDFKLTCSIKSFLYTICYRRWLNTLNKNSKNPTVRVTSINEHQLLKEAESVFDVVDLKERQSEFCKRCFSMLGESCKNILRSSWTKTGSGKFPSWKEVAEEFDLQYGYVRKKAAECIKRLIDIARNDPDFDFFKSI